MRFTKGNTPIFKYEWGCIYGLMIKALSEHLPANDIGKMLGYPGQAVNRRINIWGLKKFDLNIYNDNVKEFIKEHRNEYYNLEIAQMLDKEFPLKFFKYSPSSIATLLNKWGLNRAPEVQKKLASKRMFQEWKDGKHSGGYKKFKVGNVVIKTTERGSMKLIRTEAGWRRNHVVVWEAHHGPVPKGYNVQFKDGNQLNCDINNLFLEERTKVAHEAIRDLSDGYIGSLLLKGMDGKERAEAVAFLVESSPDIIELMRTAKKIERDAKKYQQLARGNKTDEGPLL